MRPNRWEKPDNPEIGRLGEDEAVRFLRDKGWTILARNYRWGRKEVDIVVARGQVLAFVEVKSRRGLNYGHPFEAITRAKREEIIRVARAWLRDRPPGPGTMIRFDAIAVTWTKGSGPEVFHLPDAWRLGV